MAITVQEAQVIFSADGLSQVQTKAGMAGRALDRTTTAAGGLISKLKSVRLNLGGMGSTLAGLGTGAAVGGMMSLAAGAEQTAIAFEVLLGSAEKSKDMIEAMRALDMKTVFGMRELSDAAKMMLNFGVAGEDVVPVLSMITDIAAGDSVKLEGLTRAFGQVSGAGRLMGQDLNQMIQNGFSPLETINKTTGESMASLKQRMEDGKISIDEVRQSFVWATTGAGRFAGMNDRMSQTTAGQYAKLKSEVEMLAIAMGTTLLPEANKLLEWARKFFDQTDEMPSTFSKLQTSVRDWFTETQEKFEGIGVVVGVTAVHIADRFRDAFDDIVSIAKAAFDWIQANSGRMVDNLGARMRAMKQMLLGQEVTEFTVPLGRFEMPELKSGRGSSLMQKIDEELAASRRIKADQMVAENEAKKTKKAGKDETSVDPNRRLPKQFATQMAEAGQSKTFSAEALFASLRESTLSKQLGIAQSSLSVQQQQLKIQEQQLDVAKKLDLGLA
jgi:tape measure domain-containing protein